MMIDTFWSHVARGPDDACWEWQRGRVPDGYGSVYDPACGRQVGAHRIAFVRAGGVLLPGQIVRHTCDNPPCCNPAHLVAGTQADNMHDRVERGRCGDTRPRNPQRGMARPAAKLTDDDVRRLRRDGLRGRTISAVARDLGVSRLVVRTILNGTAWRHVL